MKRRISVILACITACLLLTGCGGKADNSSTEADPAGKENAAQNGSDDSSEASVGDSGIPYEPIATGDGQDVPAPEPPANSGQLHVSVATVSISLDQLKAQDYTVPVLVTLDKNPGIIYSEWGLHIDPKCTFASSSEDCKFQTVYVDNAEQHFLWTAWTTAAVYSGTGSLLEVKLKLPMDAKPGDMYNVTYADTSLADKGDVWNDGQTDYATMDGGVTWTDGGVKVTN